MSCYRQFNPFFDQESPDVPIIGMVASEDQSPSYELDAKAVFETATGWLVVEVSGCSCWPDRGSTTQTHCTEKSEVDRLLADGWGSLKAACQDAGWVSTQLWRDN